MEDVTKLLRELRLNYKKVDEFLSSTLPYHPVQTTQQPDSYKRQGDRPFKKQCIWCDDEEHFMTRDCDEFKQAEAKNLVFWKDKKIHASMTGLPLLTNF